MQTDNEPPLSTLVVSEFNVLMNWLDEELPEGGMKNSVLEMMKIARHGAHVCADGYTDAPTGGTAMMKAITPDQVKE